MQNQDDIELGKKLQSEINSASTYYESWENKFICNELADYYDGFQWDSISDDPNNYTLNLFFATFQVKRPTLLFKKPQFYASPKPSKSNWDTGRAGNVAQLASDTLNTFVMSDSMNFAEEAESCILDAGSHFGMMEVGFDAHWVKNPNAGRPILDSDKNPIVAEGGKIVTEPEEIPQEEWVYVKRIDPRRFRVSLPDFKKLDRHKWCGYYDYIRTAELEDSRIPFKNVDEIIKNTYKPGYHSAPSASINDNDDKQWEGFNKIWHIWNNWEKKFYLLDDVSGIIIYEEPFERLPLFPLRFHKRRNGFYPIPYFFNWKSPQDETNEIRDQMRYIRRRAKRFWLHRKGAIDATEMDKLLSGPTESVLDCEGDPQVALFPVQSPPIDAAILAAFPNSRDDFNIISGTSAEARGQSGNTTATEANIIDTRSSIREADEKEVVAQWYCEIGKEILNLVMERMTLPFWVKIHQDLGSWGQDVLDIQEVWKQVEAGELAGVDFKLNFSVESLSPIAQAQEQKAFLSFLATINQYPMLSLNPDLIRETAYRLDYRNEKVIKAMQEAAQLHIMSQMAGMQQEGAGQTNMSQRTTEQMQPNTQAEIENQIANQGVPNG